MSKSKGEDKAAYRPPTPPPIRPDRSEEWRWPSPTPLPPTPTEDAGKILKQILDRLDAIEKKLEKIEKALAERQPFIP
jgi:hypothetical protein